jgi:hypothetical protein
VDREQLEPRRPTNTSTHIVYLDPRHDRPVSPYTPEGEIRMMGDFAAALSRRGAVVSRPMGILLLVLILAPIVISLLAVVTTW